MPFAKPTLYSDAASSAVEALPAFASLWNGLVALVPYIQSAPPSNPLDLVRDVATDPGPIPDVQWGSYEGIDVFDFTGTVNSYNQIGTCAELGLTSLTSCTFVVTFRTTSNDAQGLLNIIKGGFGEQTEVALYLNGEGKLVFVMTGWTDADNYRRFTLTGDIPDFELLADGEIHTIVVGMNWDVTSSVMFYDGFGMSSAPLLEDVGDRPATLTFAAGDVVWEGQHNLGGSFSNGLIGSISLMGIYNRLVTDLEAISLSSDPYGMLEVYVPPEFLTDYSDWDAKSTIAADVTEVDAEFQSLWSGLIRLLPLGEGSGHPVDFASGNTQINHGAAWETRDGSICLTFDGVDDWIELESSVLDDYDEYSILIVAAIPLGSLKNNDLYVEADATEINFCYRELIVGQYSMGFDEWNDSADGAGENWDERYFQRNQSPVAQFLIGHLFAFLFVVKVIEGKMWINGTVQGNDNDPNWYSSQGTPPNPRTPLGVAALGAYIEGSTPQNFSDSSIALCAIWNRALSDSDVVKVTSNPFKLVNFVAPDEGGDGDGGKRGIPTRLLKSRGNSK